MGGSNPNSDLFFSGNVVGFFCVFCAVFMFPIVSKKKMDRRVGVCCLTNPSFSRIFECF